MTRADAHHRSLRDERVDRQKTRRSEARHGHDRTAGAASPNLPRRSVGRGLG